MLTAYCLVLGADPAWAGSARVWFPDNLSSVGSQVDQMFLVILWITGIIFLLVEGALLWFLIRYRQPANPRAAYVHGCRSAEVIWTVIPAIIVTSLAFASQRVWAHIRGTPPAHQLEVEITAEQFAWNVRYAGPDGRLHTEDDLELINQLHLPVDQVALVHLKSKDVIHSFFVPQFRMKLDAVPGLTGRLWVQPIKPGQVEMVCAELCGLGHYRMRGYVTIESAEAFQSWLEQTRVEQSL
ncbi:MAG TPA: cytochrome c oxidase subunit II [Candidatus Omnitrophica bacterium]|nr:cytochrome c oxidase subunit II [Candidatus Omnitrophota bacterium]